MEQRFCFLAGGIIALGNSTVSEMAKYARVRGFRRTPTSSLRAPLLCAACLEENYTGRLFETNNPGREPVSVTPYFEIAFFNRRITLGAFLRVKSCSQIRKTLHPAAFSVLPTTLSRTMFLASFAAQNARLFTGRLECCGHPCQKQPSTKTASLFNRNTKSGFPNKRELRRQPVISLARIRRMRAISVFLFPLPRIRDMT